MLEPPHAPAAATPALRPVADLLAEQLEQVAEIFERQLVSDLTAINALCIHIEQYRGKMLRPTLVLLSGLAAADQPCEESALTHKHRVAAAVVEMIHMATLVHDDVLDEAEVRRRGATVNHLWGNEAAVMLGDYLISNAFHLCSTMGDPEINLRLGEVTNTLCEGELIQLHHRNDYGIDEATYFEIVRRKTASLIGECCRLGAVLSGAPGNESRHDAWSPAAALQRYGIALGIAFQIQDDLLDLIGDQRIVGKTLGKDIAKGKLTLPITHLMGSASQGEREEVLRAIQRNNARSTSELRRRLIEAGSVDYSRAVAMRFVADAKRDIEGLADSPAKELLDVLADTVVSRER